MRNVLFIVLVTTLFCTSCTKDFDYPSAPSPPDVQHQPEWYMVTPKARFDSVSTKNKYVIGSPIMQNMPDKQELPGNEGRQKVFLVVCPKILGQAQDRTPEQVRKYVDSIGYIPMGPGYLFGLDSEYHADLKLIPRNFASVYTQGLKSMLNGVPQDVGVMYLSVQTGIGNPVINAGYPWYPVATWYQVLCRKK